MWKSYITVTSVEEALQTLAELGEKARIVAGATDLILELERKVRTGIDTLIDLSRIPGLDQIEVDEAGNLRLGPLVTHNQCVASELVRARAFPLAQACWEVGAPQIRNRGTVAGNLITASPANDTIPPLVALGARLELLSARGRREVSLAEFYYGVRKVDLRPDELLAAIIIPALGPNQRGAFLKLGLRRAQAIALVNAAVVLTFEEAVPASGPLADRRIRLAAITLGSVAPTIIHAGEAEAYLAGKVLTEEAIEEAGTLAMQAAKPIDDVRSSGEYRAEMVRVCVKRCLRMLLAGDEQTHLPAHPPLLGVIHPARPAQAARHGPGEPIITRINGKEYHLEGGQHKTLLRLIREDAGLIGTKEGCAEGECGACTVFLDGAAVMSCLVPAPRAHGAEIFTIEGLAQDGQLHPVQQAFIDEGAVQCGYCTPGFIMSAVKLLEEEPHPDRDQVRQAITGNLCRCTGYYKIISAIEKAAGMAIPGPVEESI